MEDVYTIKVKTKPDIRNLYPSERRYSASTVSGLAWVHIALASTSLLLACLALANPNSEEQDLKNTTESNFTDSSNSTSYKDLQFGNFVLVLAPFLITVFGAAAGMASILASVKWYIDRNITWLFIMSVLSTIVSLASFLMISAWFMSTSEGDIADFYKDKVPFQDIVVIKHTDVLVKNESHMMISLNNASRDMNNIVTETSHGFTKRVLSINILIAAFLELLWSILSVKISYKGMRNSYKDDGTARRGNCVSVVTKIKGNDTSKNPRNKLVSPKPDLMEHYPSRKIRRLFLIQDDDGFYMKNQNNKAKQNTETSSEFYKERMMSFLNRCASLEAVSNPELNTSSVHSEPLNTIPEGVSVGNQNKTVETKETTISWGDTPEHTVYNQNTLNLEKIFNFNKQNETIENNEAKN